MMKVPDRKVLRRAYLRLMRHPGSPQYSGRGVAIGLLVAFIIPFTFHMIFALALAILFRGARVVALCATWISNPVTIPIIYPLQCYVGGFLVGRPLSYRTVAALFSDVFREPSWNTFGAIGMGLLLPFFAGGLLFGGVAALLGYHATVFMISRFRTRKEARRSMRITGMSPREPGSK